MDDFTAGLNAQQGQVLDFVALALAQLTDPERVAAAKLSELASALATLTDRWGKITDHDEALRRVDALISSIDALAAEEPPPPATSEQITCQ